MASSVAMSRLRSETGARLSALSAFRARSILQLMANVVKRYEITSCKFRKPLLDPAHFSGRYCRSPKIAVIEQATKSLTHQIRAGPVLFLA